MNEQGIDAAMRRALDLATRGPKHDANPQVGCVLLDGSGTIIAEGWHKGVGTPHAEVAALRSLPDGAARGATAVVTLEPCNHIGRTNPCSDALIHAGVSCVVYSVADPGYRSHGGAEHLREAGIDVFEGVLEDEGRTLLSDWLEVARLGRPHVTLKWASSLDGRSAADDGTSRWITGTAARQRAHKQRSTCDAILVGTGTVLSDDPSLTARDDRGEPLPDQPIPVIVGDRSVPQGAKVRQHPRTPIFLAGHDVGATLELLRARGIRRIYVEGGPTVASAFVRSGCVDEYLIYLAPSLIGGEKCALGDIGVKSIGDQHRLEITALEQLGNDILITARPLAGVETKVGR